MKTQQLENIEVENIEVEKKEKGLTYRRGAGGGEDNKEERVRMGERGVFIFEGTLLHVTARRSYAFIHLSPPHSPLCFGSSLSSPIVRLFRRLPRNYLTRDSELLFVNVDASLEII
jgi:hypothetical protein